MIIVWSPLAIDRVLEIHDFIAGDKPEAAATWVEDLFRKVRRLETFPWSGRVVPELSRSEIREILFGEYRLIYQLHKETISILTVHHSKRKFEMKA
jgi:toxin ParE1/3/4